MHTASIVVRTLNEEKHLGELLSAVRAQSLASMNVEVILVDSGSTDATMDIAEDHGCRIVTIPREEFSFGRSLNIGCEVASGELLVFVSGHCVPVDESWLETLCEPLSTGAADYVYGRQVGGDNTRFSEKQIFAKYFPEQSQIPQAGFYCNNANAAVSRAKWSEFRFDEELTGLEDMYLAKQIVHAGGKVAYVADAGVYHLHDETWAQIRRRFEREALALQRILPNVHVRQRDVVRYILSSIWMDFRRASVRGQLRKHAGEIVRYRFNQYVGSYLGNRLHQELSHFDKERYFYPDAVELDERNQHKSSLPSAGRPTRAAR